MNTVYLISVDNGQVYENRVWPFVVTTDEKFAESEVVRLNVLVEKFRVQAGPMEGHDDDTPAGNRKFDRWLRRYKTATATLQKMLGDDDLTLDCSFVCEPIRVVNVTLVPASMRLKVKRAK